MIISSDDLDRTLDAVRTAGGSVTHQPYAFPGGPPLQFTDPRGNELAVWASA